MTLNNKIKADTRDAILYFQRILIKKLDQRPSVYYRIIHQRSDKIWENQRFTILNIEAKLREYDFTD